MYRSALFYLGNLFIGAALIGFLYIFYPIFQLYFFPSTLPVQKVNANGFTITIPKIQASANVIANVDPWNAVAYRKALEHGVAQAKGTSLPGQTGTMFLFAHSSDLPWLMTRYNTPFFRLGELTLNDPVMINYKGKTYFYKVVDRKIVWPSEISYLTQQKKTQLILQTCYPIGTSFQRLLIFAVPISP